MSPSKEHIYIVHRRFNSHPSESLLLSPNHCLCVSTTKIGNPPNVRKGELSIRSVSCFFGKFLFSRKIYVSFYSLSFFTFSFPKINTRGSRDKFPFFLLLTREIDKREMCVKILRTTRHRASIV